jgi:hypothetical protein
MMGNMTHALLSRRLEEESDALVAAAGAACWQAVADNLLLSDTGQALLPEAD